MSKHREFENECRREFEVIFGVSLRENKVLIKTKNKSFDFVNQEKKIVGDAKNYKNTVSGNIPSAKRSKYASMFGYYKN